jgi:TP901 family phage tail tape measure protein
MSQQSQVWSLGMDVSGALAGLSQLIGGIKNQNATMQDAMLTMVNYNAKLNQFQATTQGFNSAGDKVKMRSSFNPTTGITGLENFSIKPDDRPSAMDNMSNVLSSIGSVAQFQLLKQAINAVSHAFVEGIQNAVQFQIKVSEIRTISQDANITFNQWSQQLQTLSDKFGMPQVDVAAAAYEALSNQVVKGSQAFGFMDKALQFGQVTVATAKQSVDLLSSAIKSFELNVSDTDYIAATLFKTIELGRVKAEEMAQSFGRVASMSHVIGVSLEETEAAIATLTIQGMKYSDASTLLTNVLLKLAKPTGEMKKLMEGWGTPTGEAAVATFGFAGVLRKVAEAAQGSTAELAELFNEMRALKGAVGLTKFAGFEENLAEIKGGAEAYKNAIEIIGESPGKQLQVEFNKIKNFFTDDLGQKGLNAINEVTKSFGGLANIIKSVSTTTLVAVATFGTFTASLKAASLAQAFLNLTAGLFTTTTASGTVVVGGMTLALRGLGVALVTLGPAIGIATAAWVVYKMTSDQATQETLKQSENLRRIGENLKKNSITRFVEQGELAQFKDGIATTFGKVGEIMANSLIGVNNKLKTLREDAAKFGDVLAINFKSLVDNINEGIRNINQGIREAQSAIKESQKSLTNYKLSLEDSLFSFKLDLATPQQQVQFLNERIRQLRVEAQAQFATGDKDEVESARRKYEEIARLAKESFNKQIEIFKQSMAANGGGLYNGAPAIESLKRTYQDFLDERNNLEKQYQALQRKTIENFQELEAKEKARVNTIETAVKKFLELQKAITDGTIMTDEKFKEKFKDGQGLFDPNKVQTALEEQAKIIIAMGGSNAKALIDLYDNLEKQKTNLFKVNTAERTAIEIGEEQKKLSKLKDIQEGKLKELTDAAGKAGTEIPTAFQAIAATLNDLSTALDVDGGTIVRRMQELFSIHWDAPKVRASADAYIDAKNAIKDTFDLISKLNSPNTNFKDANVIKGMSDDVNKLEARLRQINTVMDEFIKKRIGTDNTSGNTFIKNPQNGEAGITFKQAFEDSLKQLELAREALTKVEQAKKEFDRIKDLPKQIIDNSTGALRDAFERALTESDRATTGMSDGFADVGQEINRAVEAVESMKRAIERLNATPINPIPSGVLGGVPNPVAKATGGYIGGPIGADNIPAWLSRARWSSMPKQLGPSAPCLRL